MIAKSKPEDAPPYYQKYIDAVSDTDLIAALENEMQDALALMRNIPEDKGTFAYAEGKWTIKQVISHVIDTERIFNYRALRISRADGTPLSGFDENKYAPNANTENRSLHDIIEEYSAVRKANILFFQSLTDEMLETKGSANSFTMTPKAIGWMIAGHSRHHFNIIRERYLNEGPVNAVGI
jgi:uncharacterized damage-inducible protein DinB